MEIKQVALVDVQPEKQTNEAIVNLIPYKPVSDKNIGLSKIKMDTKHKYLVIVYL